MVVGDVVAVVVGDDVAVVLVVGVVEVVSVVVVVGDVVPGPYRKGIRTQYKTTE